MPLAVSEEAAVVELSVIVEFVIVVEPLYAKIPPPLLLFALLPLTVELVMFKVPAEKIPPPPKLPRAPRVLLLTVELIMVITAPLEVLPMPPPLYGIVLPVT